MKQLVYRQQRMQRFPLSGSGQEGFYLLRKGWDVVPLFIPLARCFGLAGLLKTVLKLASGKRALYVVLAGGGIAHHGWVFFSFCRYYPVLSGDAVIGPILTDPRYCGRGYATMALQYAMNEMMEGGFRVFWIDTSEDNIPCRKVIEKCGFGAPVESFERPENGL